ncbi:MAG TPA: hypothetical protein PLS68_05085 [Actinotalea sp.]|nr:hypothetical protein [Actinotalea sp.]
MRHPGPGGRPPAGVPQRGDVLELRVHGVNNTPPPALLDLGPADIAQVAGDDLGSFWRPTAEVLARLTPADRGHVPDGVVREAYSWGGLARTSPTAGTGTVGVMVGGLARVGWALLLPFGLVNVAFWSRRLDQDRGWTHGWQDGASAAALRVFALLLTLLLLGTSAVVSLDLVASQCFAGGQRWCAQLPPALDGLATLSSGRRLAVGTVLPLATLVLVAVLARVSRARYEQLAAAPAERAGVPDGAPALATPGFWANARLTAASGRMHVAGGLFFLVLTTAWHQVFGTGDACTSPAELLGSQSAACRAQLAALPGSAAPFAVTLALAVTGLLLTLGALVSRAWGDAALPGDSPARVTRWSRRLAWSGAVLLAAHLTLLTAVDHRTAGLPLLGLVATPALLATLLLALAWSARWWRRTADGRFEAWGGRAPGVFLQLSVGVALTLSSVTVVAAGDWLNGGRPAGDLLRGGIGLPGSVPAPGRDGCTVVCPVPDPQLSIPSVYVWFGAATFVTLVAVLAIAGLSAARTSRTLPAAGPVSRALRRGHRPGGQLDELAARPGAEPLLRRARRSAAVAHRAEPVTRVLAEASALCTAAAVALTAAIAVRPGLGPPQLRRVAAEGFGAGLYAGLVDTAAWGAGIVGVAVVAGMVGGAASGRTRPLGLAWDLICLLPRTGHPFGPPCYAERVVPELVRRYAEWVEPAGGVPTRGRRRVVVSAHSLGAVLTVASVLAARTEHGARLTDRISLLTYGTQLRPYFGRMFPELFGPAVLGTARGRGARLLTPDPWRDAIVHDETSPPAGPSPAGSLVATLTGPGGAVRWVNLWRRTDYLGFPLDGYTGSRFDRAAEELDTSGYLPAVATHGGYPRAGGYAAALADLVGGPSAGSDGPRAARG